MTRPAMFAMAALMLLGAAPAHAKIDCSKDYSDFWKKLMENGGQRIEGAKLADVQRNALRGFDACQAGDEITPHGVWDKILADMKK